MVNNTIQKHSKSTKIFETFKRIVACLLIHIFIQFIFDNILVIRYYTNIQDITGDIITVVTGNPSMLAHYVSSSTATRRYCIFALLYINVCLHLYYI